MKKHSITICCVALGTLALMMSTGCQESTTPTVKPVSIDTTGVSSSGTMRFEGEIISIPSPVLIAAVLQKNNIQFKQDLLNQLQNKNKYVNETKKALNLGVYGANLAYLSNYNMGQTTVDYFDAVASLASELEILDKVDRKIISSFQSNMDHRDSLLALNGDFFRAADLYLKSSERTHLSSYILIGGWVESMHLIMDAAGQNEELRKRLAEQKYSAGSIKYLISKLNDTAFSKIKAELENVCKTLEGLESTYVYRQPINDQREKKTYLRSLSSVKLPDDKLATLKEQVSTVRNLIIE